MVEEIVDTIISVLVASRSSTQWWRRSLTPPSYLCLWQAPASHDAMVEEIVDAIIVPCSPLALWHCDIVLPSRVYACNVLGSLFGLECAVPLACSWQSLLIEARLPQRDCHEDFVPRWRHSCFDVGH
eukprot:6490244-Amphidinium_carterae.1